MVERGEPMASLFRLSLCPYLGGVNYLVFLFFLIHKIDALSWRCGIFETDSDVFACLIITVERDVDRLSVCFELEVFEP